MADTPNNKEKPILTPPQGERPQRSSNPLIITLVILCLVILLVLAGIVIWLLPTQAPLQPDQEISLQETSIEHQKGVDIASDPEAVAAEQLLGEWLKALAEAEGENVQAWGGDEFADILNGAAQGDQFFRDSDFGKATNAYEGAINDLGSLLAAKQEKLIDFIAQGQQALDNNESRNALLFFQQAFLIDPENEEALHGAHRANNLDQVLALYNEGLRLEEESNLEQAQKRLLEASGLDSDFIPAGEALKHVEKQLQDLTFKDAMSRAIAALDNGQITVANEALEVAAQLRPNDPSVASARLRSKEISKVQQLKKLQVKAGQLISAEEWEGVVATYQKAIQIDDMVSFATIGLPEAEKRVQLDKSLKSVIARPDRLQDEGPLREARQILKSAQRVKDPGKVLQAQIRTLSDQVKNASTTVEVVLRSNNATEVEIYHVGRFRPFIEKPVILRPGKYTVVGRRPGFKDVRLSITITADMKMPVFFVHCEEPI